MSTKRSYILKQICCFAKPKHHCGNDSLFDHLKQVCPSCCSMQEGTKIIWRTLPEKSPYLEFLWSVFSFIWTEYGEIRSISPYSVRMRENTDQKNSEYGHFSRNGIDQFSHKTVVEALAQCY